MIIFEPWIRFGLFCWPLFAYLQRMDCLSDRNWLMRWWWILRVGWAGFGPVRLRRLQRVHLRLRPDWKRENAHDHRRRPAARTGPPHVPAHLPARRRERHPVRHRRIHLHAGAVQRSLDRSHSRKPPWGNHLPLTGSTPGSLKDLGGGGDASIVKAKQN